MMFNMGDAARSITLRFSIMTALQTILCYSDHIKKRIRNG